MNNQENEINKIEEGLSLKIKSGEITMKPKAYFILKTILITTVSVVLFLFVIYTVSFLIFSLQTSGIWSLPSFDFHDIRILLSSLPWLLIVLSIVLILALEIFAKRIAFVYHRPIMYSLILIIIVVFLASFLISLTSLHSNLFERARNQRLPIVGQWYRNYGTPRIDNIHKASDKERRNSIESFNINKTQEELNPSFSQPIVQ